MFNSETAVSRIAELTAGHANGRSDGGAAAGAVIECIVGATVPMVASMFNGGTLQERLLFALVLAGACTQMGDAKEDYSVIISVTPENLREAFNVFTKLTGHDMRPNLPKAMLAFAAERGALH